ncbi:hypothetical protein HPB50_016563 [Hyalomma asiaticum]|uniref:Uncharacterized protein n=1 Tax=Hyalomma asiaticum TaxID=266040 RepID=A0ACB7S9N6_HYAAI|nr:hypothetical protein HPB50_016563 [Hyalomma asiaticum]
MQCTRRVYELKDFRASRIELTACIGVRALKSGSHHSFVSLRVCSTCGGTPNRTQPRTSKSRSDTIDGEHNSGEVNTFGIEADVSASCSGSIWGQVVPQG